MRRTRLLGTLGAVALSACVYDLDFRTQSSTDGGAPLCAPGATAPCYDGPAGTEGVGICKAGAKTCAADGMSWGACAGEVLPQPVDCASGMDLHCDGKVPVCKGKVLWAKGWGGPSTQGAASGITADPTGAVLFTGSFSGTVDFGGGPLTAAIVDGFLVKLDPQGNHVWSRHFGSPPGMSTAYAVTPRALAVDALGNAVVTGSFDGVVDFGGGPLTSTGLQDLFVVKYDASGTHVWSVHFGLAGQATAMSVAVDASGVVLAGYYTTPFDFGQGMLPSSGKDNVFVAKLDPSGTSVWSRGFGGPSGSKQEANGVALSASSDVVVTGFFSSTLDFGGGPLVSGSGDDAFLLTLDASGHYVSSSPATNSTGSMSVGLGIAAAPAGGTFTCGDFSGGVNFGAGLLQASAVTSAFLVKRDSSGATQWSSSFGGASSDTAQAVAVAADAVGNTIVAGNFTSKISFDGPPLLSQGGQDVFLARLDGSGAVLWGQTFGGPSTQAVGGVAADPSGNTLLAGTFDGLIDFGSASGPLMTMGGADIFVAKLSP